MILVSNVKITNVRLYASPNRGHLSNPDRMAVWKYTLASYVPLLPLISKIILNIDLASTEYAGQEPELETYIRTLFPDNKLVLKWARNNTTADWRKSYLEDVLPVDDDLIFNVTNDDHIFVDSDLTFITDCITHLKNSNEPFAQIVYSHHPEGMRHAARSGYKPSEDFSCLIGHGRMVSSLDIIKKERWRHYWFDYDYGDKTNVFRPDEWVSQAGAVPNGSTQFMPLRELVRHFDGYEHAAPFLNLCPPLEIPPGFFQRQIKIAYGYDYNKEGYVNINPLSKNLKAYDGVGADYKYSLEDIPLFWRDRIVEIDVNPDADLAKMNRARDEFLYSIAGAPIHGVHVAPVGTPLLPSIFKKQFLTSVYD
jgi:hypothetical protein